MHKIIKATLKDAQLLSDLATASFLTSHVHSAPKNDIDSYIALNLQKINFEVELNNQQNQFYLLYYKNEIAGYSKIVFNKPNTNVTAQNIALMNRLYLLKEFYQLGLGKILFDFNVDICKQQDQKGIWLAVWVENVQAIQFYTKKGFTKVGDYNFQISKTHSNPNHILYLEF